MAVKYFENFQKINYQGQQIVDITERAVFLNNVLKNPYLFYPYDVTEDERPDQFANRYYGTPYYSWLIYLSNNIIDPYYEWPMPQEDFDNFIQKKYNHFEVAQRKIKYWENNYFDMDNISVSDFDALVPTLIKYWEPIFDIYGNIIEYTRKKQDQKINTNAIILYNLSTVPAGNYINDEICYIKDIYNAIIGQGQVLSYDSTANIINLNHVVGNYTPDLSIGEIGFLPPFYFYSYLSTTYSLVGDESGVSTQFNKVTPLIYNLLPEEVVYWTSVTYYEYEQQKNELNKAIRVVDSNYSNKISEGLENFLNPRI